MGVVGESVSLDEDDEVVLLAWLCGDVACEAARGGVAVFDGDAGRARGGSSDSGVVGAGDLCRRQLPEAP